MIFVSSWPARPTNGIALDVFVGARRLADEHQIGVRIADAEDDLPASERVQLAARAVADVGAHGGQRLRGVSRHGDRLHDSAAAADGSGTRRSRRRRRLCARQAGSRLTPATPSSAAKRRCSAS